ncbi:MAG: ribonuclease III [Chloroflexi bacterium]|nr:ribonuclease III [Chloroflexota bacterium]
MADNLEEGRDRPGISFNDPGILEIALTHDSLADINGGGAVKSNERLEFLGDAVLELVIAEHLYNRFPGYTEGELAITRASLVNTRFLAEKARQIGLGSIIRLSKGEDAAGGRKRNSILAAAFEAFIGAVYLDRGIETVKAYILSLFGNDLEAARAGKDNKTLLQEILQKDFQGLPEYEVINEAGPPHKKRFTVEVRFDGRTLGAGEGSNKKEAEQMAAGRALENMACDCGNSQNE